jgi:alpha-galactosidase
MSRIVTIGRGSFALSLRLPDRGMPQILSFGGPPVEDDALFDVERASRINGMDVAVPAAVLLPTGGLGFFGWPAICGHRDGRDFVLDFGDWTVTTQGPRTRLAGVDTLAGLGIGIDLAVHAGGVIGISTTLTNLGREPYRLDRCMAATFLIPAGEVELTTFTGSWGREFQVRSERPGPGMWVQESRRGRTSHDRSPMLSVRGDGADFAVALGASGGHTIVVDRIDDGRRLIHLGELFEPGEIVLDPGGAYSSPVAYAGHGPDAFHALVREDLLDWPGGAMRPRPVTLNTWEGTYFRHDPANLMAQADAAAALGVERFVLDDGWFGRRDDDTTSLGDWSIDRRKYPDGLKPLVDHVVGLGMEFGIWFEPEMVNPDSDLFRAHPDWILRVEGRPLLTSRNQLVLDVARPEVSDYLFGCLDAVLGGLAVSYVKWDMNRDLTHAGGSDGRAGTVAQTRAVLALMDRVRAAHPGVEIESCASGGGRIDMGVLRRTHRVWTSDCTDALERLEIQRGLSLFLPPEIMGAHVSASPNHQTFRRHSLSFRALVAMAYHFGIEMDPLSLSPEETSELAGYVATYRRLRGLLHAPGAAFRTDPLDGRHVWGAAGSSRIAVFVAQGPQMVSEQPAPLRLPPGVADAGGVWRVARVHPAAPNFIRISDGQRRLLRGEVPFRLANLARSGLPLPGLRPESAVLLELEPVQAEVRRG